jgi:hypothetical protein
MSATGFPVGRTKELPKSKAPWILDLNEDFAEIVEKFDPFWPNPPGVRRIRLLMERHNEPGRSPIARNQREIRTGDGNPIWMEASRVRMNDATWHLLVWAHCVPVRRQYVLSFVIQPQMRIEVHSRDFREASF